MAPLSHPDTGHVAFYPTSGLRTFGSRSVFRDKRIYYVCHYDGQTADALGILRAADNAGGSTVLANDSANDRMRRDIARDIPNSSDVTRGCGQESAFHSIQFVELSGRGVARSCTWMDAQLRNVLLRHFCALLVYSAALAALLLNYDDGVLGNCRQLLAAICQPIRLGIHKPHAVGIHGGLRNWLFVVSSILSGFAHHLNRRNYCGWLPSVLARRASILARLADAWRRASSLVLPTPRAPRA